MLLFFRFRQSPAEDLPFESGTVDLITAMTAAHWFDRPRFFKEADRVLKPGGCLALLSSSLDMELEYGDVSDKLKDICKEVRPATLTKANSISVLGQCTITFQTVLLLGQRTLHLHIL